jgi:hypothetical protein
LTKKFQRKIENFVCEHCGQQIEGDGYTNHCARCLWSKHVDIQPGDRLADCGGMMEPVAVSGSTNTYRILHRCQFCGLEKWNQAQAEDDFETILAVARAQAKRNLG